jgi:hypothetical protein
MTSRGHVVASGKPTPVVQIPVPIHDEGSAAAGVQQCRLDAGRGDPREQLGVGGSGEFPLGVQSHPVPPGVFVEVRELTWRFDLAGTMAGVDEEDFPLGVHDDAGSRVSEGSGHEQSRQECNRQDSDDEGTSHGCTSSSRMCHSELSTVAASKRNGSPWFWKRSLPTSHLYRKLFFRECIKVSRFLLWCSRRNASFGHGATHTRHCYSVTVVPPGGPALATESGPQKIDTTPVQVPCSLYEKLALSHRETSAGIAPPGCKKWTCATVSIHGAREVKSGAL